MALNSTSQLAKLLADQTSETDEIKSNISPDDLNSSLPIFINESPIKLTGEITLTAYTYATDSFVIDHPVYSVLGSRMTAAGLLSYTDMACYLPMYANAEDETDNGNNGAVTGATRTNDRFSRDSHAYSFSGVGDYITIADSSSLDITSAITVAGWFYNRVPKTSTTYQAESYPGAVGDSFGSYRRARTSTDSAGVMVSIPRTNTVYGSTTITVSGYTSAGGTSGIMTIAVTDDVTAEVLYTTSTVQSRTVNGQLLFTSFCAKGNNFTITVTFLDVQDVYIDSITFEQPGRATILSKRETAYEILISGGNYRIRMTVGGVSRSWDTGVAVTSGAWTFYTLTYDSTTLRFYINGSQVYSSTSFSGAIAANANAITIGAINQFAGTNETSFYGYMGEQFILNRALSGPETLAIYNFMLAYADFLELDGGYATTPPSFPLTFPIDFDSSDTILYSTSF